MLVSPINLQQHKFTFHGEDSAYVNPEMCHVCGRAFFKVSALKEHMETHYWGEEGEATTDGDLNPNLRYKNIAF